MGIIQGRLTKFQLIVIPLIVGIASRATAIEYTAIFNAESGLYADTTKWGFLPSAPVGAAYPYNGFNGATFKVQIPSSHSVTVKNANFYDPNGITVNDLTIGGSDIDAAFFTVMHTGSGSTYKVLGETTLNGQGHISVENGSNLQLGTLTVLSEFSTVTVYDSSAFLGGLLNFGQNSLKTGNYHAVDGVISFQGADVRKLEANLTLVGSARLEDQSGNNALHFLSEISGQLEVFGQDRVVQGNLALTGGPSRIPEATDLKVSSGTFKVNGTFNNAGGVYLGEEGILDVSGGFANLSGTTLEGGEYYFDGGKIFLGNAPKSIETNRANLNLLIGDLNAAISYGNGQNALANLALNDTGGTISIGSSVAYFGRAASYTRNGNLRNRGNMLVNNHLTVTGTYYQEEDYTYVGGYWDEDTGEPVSGSLTASQFLQTGGQTQVEGKISAGLIRNDHGHIFGAGELEGEVINNGLLEPAVVYFDSLEMRVSGSLKLEDDSILQFRIDGIGEEGDITLFPGKLRVNGLLTLGGKLSISEFLTMEGNAFFPEQNDVFTFVTATRLAGSFENVASGGRLWTEDGSGSFLVTYTVGMNGSIVFSDFQIIPEPTTGALAWLGLAMCSGYRFRRPVRRSYRREQPV